MAASRPKKQKIKILKKIAASRRQKKLYQGVSIKPPPRRNPHPPQFRFSKDGSETRTPLIRKNRRKRNAHPPSPPQAKIFRGILRGFSAKMEKFKMEAKRAPSYFGKFGRGVRVSVPSGWKRNAHPPNSEIWGP